MQTNETARPDTDRLLRIAAAAEQFVQVVNTPRTGPGYEFRQRQQAAYDRLVEVVGQSVAEREAVDATDS
jgi:hypothetical protein